MKTHILRVYFKTVMGVKKKKKDLKVGNRSRGKVLNSENTHTLKKQAQNTVWKINNGLQEKMNQTRKGHKLTLSACLLIH